MARWICHNCKANLWTKDGCLHCGFNLRWGRPPINRPPLQIPELGDGALPIKHNTEYPYYSNPKIPFHEVQSRKFTIIDHTKDNKPTYGKSILEQFYKAWATIKRLKSLYDK